MKDTIPNHINDVNIPILKPETVYPLRIVALSNMLEIVKELVALQNFKSNQHS